MLFAYFDGDNVGNTIEILLIENRISEAILLSENIKSAISKIGILLNNYEGLETLIIGGDDILIKFDSKQYGIEHLEEIRSLFGQFTGLTMSCGVGISCSDAIRQLYMAKLYGKSQIRWSSS